MKKFHFYLQACMEPNKFIDGTGVGIEIRFHRLSFKDHIGSKWRNAVKVTFFLSQRRLKSIRKAKLRGFIDLSEEYAPQAIIKAIRRYDCSTWLDDSFSGTSKRWYARAKVERV